MQLIRLWIPVSISRGIGDHHAKLKLQREKVKVFQGIQGGKDITHDDREDVVYYTENGKLSFICPEIKHSS
jgi:hypothetical protein